MLDPGFPDPSADQGTFTAIFGVIATIVVIGIIITIIVAVVNAKKVVDAGHNPLTLQTELELKVLDSAALAPSTTPATPGVAHTSAADPPPPADSIEERLHKLADLHARNLISDEELAAARAKVLAE
ncbi:MAG TPA: hypothetical protein VGM94_18665 [Galbitalea sp.]|jgi:hypothetical protein